MYRCVRYVHVKVKQELWDSGRAGCRPWALKAHCGLGFGVPEIPNPKGSTPRAKLQPLHLRPRPQTPFLRASCSKIRSHKP